MFERSGGNSLKDFYRNNKSTFTLVLCIVYMVLFSLLMFEQLEPCDASKLLSIVLFITSVHSYNYS